MSDEMPKILEIIAAVPRWRAVHFSNAGGKPAMTETAIVCWALVEWSNGHRDVLPMVAAGDARASLVLDASPGAIASPDQHTSDFADALAQWVAAQSTPAAPPPDTPPSSPIDPPPDAPS